MDKHETHQAENGVVVSGYTCRDGVWYGVLSVRGQDEQKERIEPGPLYEENGVWHRSFRRVSVA